MDMQLNTTLTIDRPSGHAVEQRSGSPTADAIRTEALVRQYGGGRAGDPQPATVREEIF